VDSGPALGARKRELDDRDRDVRREAAWALGQRGSGAAAALGRLLRDPEERVRAEAAAALGRVLPWPGPEIPARLAEALDDARQSVRWRAAESLSRAVPSGFDVMILTPHLRSSDPHVRQFAAWALGEAGAAARAATTDLAAALRAGDPGLRAVAVKSLARVASREPEALQALSEVLADTSWPERWRAARTLRHFGAGAVPALLAGLSSPDETVRLESALALAEIGPEAESARDALTRAAGDENAEVRRAAEKALRRIRRR
jgi:HEAT repeat protein